MSEVEFPKRITAGWLKEQTERPAAERLQIGQVLSSKSWTAQELVDRGVDPELFGFGNGNVPTPAGPKAGTAQGTVTAPAPTEPDQPDASDVQDAIAEDVDAEPEDEGNVCPGCGHDKPLRPEGFCEDCISFT